MIIVKGISASPGIAIGPAYLVKPDNTVIEKKRIPSTNVGWELRRFEEAVERCMADLDASQAQVKTLFGSKYAKLIAAHKLILKDPLLISAVKNKIEKEQISAEYALSCAAREITVRFESLKDELFRERKYDLADVAKRLFENLTKKKQNKFSGIKEPSIIIAHNLFPSDTINLKGKNVLGFATDIGGKTSHTALLAQSMQMPAVVGLSDASSQIKDGDLIILDGETGLIIINPEPKILEQYKEEQRKIDEAELSLKQISPLPNETSDGHKVSLYINYDPRRDFKAWNAFRSDGLGLLRTEFIYMDRFDPPSEDEQYQIYKKTAQRFDKRPVTIRLADLGGDKITQLGLGRREKESNPFMGCRGIRLFLKYPELLYSQLRAIVRASAEVEASVKIMIPMVSSVEEVRAVRSALKQVLKETEDCGIIPRRPITLGAMIEVPSAALSLDGILPEVDFISIGTNDLIQYLIAVDRGNQEVAELYDPYHPAVLRTINFIIQGCRKKGKPVSVCGEMASDPEMVPFLVGLGVDILSLSPRMFLRIKSTLRSLNFEDCANLAQAAILLTSSEEIKNLQEDYSL
ncbi:MAG: phosphoenolpyruvate--protein phosphotransferase [Elusimicrobia bacterium]|nr:phosphoenolpyruvate--protein phosphotransferase [Elusimicrobiota bacterium]